MNCYDMEGIKTELKKELSSAKTFKRAWEKVTFPTKKDGSVFKILSKNINGAKLHQNEFNPTYGENELTVYTQDPMNGYVHDTIYCYCLVKDIPENDDRRNKPDNVVYRSSSGYYDLYSFDIQDIKKAVETRIAYCAARIDSLEKQIANLERAYIEFRESYSKAVSRLNEIFPEQYATAKLAIIDTVNARFPYC